MTQALVRVPLRLAVSVVVFVAVALPADVHAQSRVVVLPFEGSGAARLREDVVKELARQDDIELVASADAQEAADSRGADLTTNDGRARVAGELSVSAFVGGSVERSGARRELTVVVYDGADGSAIGEASFSGPLPAVRRAVRKGLWSEIGSAIGKGRAPAAAPEEPEEEEELVPEEEPEREPEPEPEPEDEPEDDDSGEPSPDAIQFRLGFTAASRVFSYEDDLHGNLRDYCLAPWCDSFGLGPLVNFGLRWYPGTHFTDGFGANIGLDFRGSIMLGVSSQQQDDTGEFDTTHRRIGIGLRLRVPIDDHELGFVVGYGNYAFEVEAGSDFTGLPAVSYGFVRLEGSGRIMVADSLGLLVSAAYLVPIAYGEIAEDEWFPRTSGGGMEAEIGGVYELLGWLDAELALSMTRFFFSHNPEPGDLSAGDPYYRVAGGSTDRSFALRTDLVAHF